MKIFCMFWGTRGTSYQCPRVAQVKFFCNEAKN